MTPDRTPDFQSLDENLARLLDAALDGPARPMTRSQIDRILQAAARAAQPVPLGAVAAGMAGLFAMALVGILLPPHDTTLRTLAIVVPAINLVAAPLASLAIILRRRQHYE